PTEVSAFAWLDHDVLEVDTIDLEYADDVTYLTNQGTISITWRENNLLEFFTPLSRRYWRFIINKGASAVYRSAGRFVLGTYFELAHSAREPGFVVTPALTTSKSVRTEGGQLYGDIGVVLERMAGSIPAITDDEKADLVALINANSTVIPFIAAFDFDLYPAEKTIYGAFDRIPSMVSAPSHYRWEMQFSITEQT
ncbi:unnamed protein product, partial [marine sediment metagenome]